MMEKKITRRRFLIDTLGATALLMMPGTVLGKLKKEEETGCFLYDDIYLEHDTGENHPETPARLTAISNAVMKAKWYDDLIRLKARAADPEILSLVHDKKYIGTVKKECDEGRLALSTSDFGDTGISKQSYLIALKAVGGVLRAVDTVVDGKAKNAFCAVRPPGHHARRKRGTGFCIFNNIAIAARYAQKNHGIKRVLIADWDVHHGDGTQSIFYSDDTVFFMSTHQSPWYPWSGQRRETGRGKGKGFTMNRPFPAGAGNKQIIGAFKNDLLPAAKKFKPDLTLISAGFDSRIGDPLGGFKIDDEGFRELTKLMLEISYIAGDGKLVSVLEGGYNLRGLASAVYAHMDEMSKA
jgi:acetoin utilization deacetylase AcuC-like enzyme